MSIKISTGKVKSAYGGGRIPLQGTSPSPAGVKFSDPCWELILWRRLILGKEAEFFT